MAHVYFPSILFYLISLIISLLSLFQLSYYVHFSSDFLPSILLTTYALFTTFSLIQLLLFSFSFHLFCLFSSLPSLSLPSSLLRVSQLFPIILPFPLSCLCLSSHRLLSVPLILSLSVELFLNNPIPLNCLWCGAYSNHNFSFSSHLIFNSKHRKKLVLLYRGSRQVN